MTDLPPPRAGEPYRIAVVCLGNICRSPMADVVLRARLADAGLTARVVVDSAGTASWHTGKPMDPRAAATLTAAGYDATRHRARHFDRTWTDRYDLVLAMDRSNLGDLRALAGPAADRVRLFRDFDPADPGAEVPDPYYGGEEGFADVLATVERTSTAIVAALQQKLVEP